MPLPIHIFWPLSTQPWLLRRAVVVRPPATPDPCLVRSARRHRWRPNAPSPAASVASAPRSRTVRSTPSPGQCGLCGTWRSRGRRGRAPSLPSRPAGGDRRGTRTPHMEGPRCPAREVREGSRSERGACPVVGDYRVDFFGHEVRTECSSARSSGASRVRRSLSGRRSTVLMAPSPGSERSPGRTRRPW